MNADHSELQRDMGRMEAGLDAVKEAMQQGFKQTGDRIAEVKDELADMRTDIAALKEAESKRKGAMGALAVVASAIGAAVTFVVEHFLK